MLLFLTTKLSDIKKKKKNPAIAPALQTWTLDGQVTGLYLGQEISIYPCLLH